MHDIGIIANTSKDNNLEITRSIIGWIESHDCRALFTDEISSRLGINKSGFPRDIIFEKSEFVIVLGGDGTILGVAREASKYDTPILGVNLGRLGFLAEVEVRDIFKSLECALDGRCEIQKRLMLQAFFVNGRASGDELYALNDIVITRGMLSRIVTLKIYINDDYVTTINGDGLIIATPTGSTAYSLSAGGPIVSPDLSVIIITPICPHSFSNRSIIISDWETVKIDLTENKGDAYLTIDGQEGYKTDGCNTVLVKRAPYSTNLIKLPERSFYDVLKTKLTEV
jgi:NAD+ kinase